MPHPGTLVPQTRFHAKETGTSKPQSWFRFYGAPQEENRYLTYLGAQPASKKQPHNIRMPLSNKQVTWLLVKAPADLNEQEQQELAMLREASPTADQVYHLVQEFGQMVRERQ
ncbi:hypothetical protein KDH_10070 [Dictyobacter sp. S3.2.2.5]|uniref:Uncharacterized protein n=1 Tax=Dictyobacter halimunensis TaxID=3026934 RepID=A0ABQ6FJ02_9CHLR|nr:hypothetical protein KDH_10070 [Dictyobacter sp. S3.2.2.5]